MGKKSSYKVKVVVEKEIFINVYAEYSDDAELMAKNSVLEDEPGVKKIVDTKVVNFFTKE